MPISETHVSSPPGANTRAESLAPTARRLSFSVYQSDTFVNAWILANVLGALSVLCADTGVSAAEFATWAIFLLGNCGLLKRVLTDSDDARAKAGHSLDALTAIAVIFGLLWAWPLHWAIGGGELPQAFTVMIGGGVVLLALPLFAPRGAAYFALLTGFCGALGALFLAHGVAWWSIGGLLAFLLPTVIMARLYRALIANVEQLLEHGLGAVSPAPLESHDYLDHARSKIGALRHQLVDHARLRATLHAMADGVVRVNALGIIDYMNPAAERMTGYDLREARGLPLGNVVMLQAPGAHELAANAVATCLDRGELFSSDEGTTLRPRDGGILRITFTVAPLCEGDTRVGAVLLVRDITDARDHAHTSAARAALDPLTSLCNRFEFESRLQRTLETPLIGGASLHALCVINLEHFTFIKDTYGSAAGDRVLLSLAELLTHKIRGVDLLARFDDAAFGLLLYNSPIDQARLIAAELCGLIDSFHCAWQDNVINVRACAGVIAVQPGQTTLTETLIAVDIACSTARRARDNRVYALQADDATRRRNQALSQVKELQTALRYDNFELYFQPLLAIAERAHVPVYCELQLRMSTQTGVLLGPRDFLLTAERYHLLTDLDRWLTKAAINALCRHHPALAGVGTVGLSISAQSVLDETFLQFVTELIEHSAVPRARLCFEIAESHLIRQWDRGCAFIAAVKGLGCQVALDGFGVGTHSFQLLKKLPVDYLKIHPDFVRNVAFNSVDFEVLLGIARIAKTLRIQTIATGVQNLATRDILRGMGVDFAQGFLVEQSRPLTVLPRAVH